MREIAGQSRAGGSSGSHVPAGSSGAAENGGWSGRVPAGRSAANGDPIDLCSDSDSEESEEASGSDDEEEEEPSWIQWFISLRGNEFFCEIEEE